MERVRIVISGAVQGVGFRPFVYRLASVLDLTGWVANSPQGVTVEVEGERASLERFLLSLERDKPSPASIHSLETTFLDPVRYRRFEIRASDAEGPRVTIVLPDIATCRECLEEVRDPNDRRRLYPFTNCTNCGPRYSIIESLPYDRAGTSMKRFVMCERCRREYEDPLDRRFHAQPNACPDCGPQLELWDGSGGVLSARHEALMEAAQAVRSGRIVAVKGLGGFHLVVDALDDDAVRRLRDRKHREEKPFALMAPGLEWAVSACFVSPFEERLLTSPESPIVLLRRRDSSETGAAPVAPSVAPGNPFLGVVFPYTPLHHILMDELGFPVVATSGNLSEEPICVDEGEALERLGAVADLFLVHDRPIVRHVDDSVVRVLLGREMVVRRARGYAPLPFRLRRPAPRLLAVGGHLKNTVAVTVNDNVFVSQHIGDLENVQAWEAFCKTVSSLQALYETEPECIVSDLHPDYLSTRFAESYGLPVLGVQHHFAHVASCMAENELEGPLLGVSWDGTGYGLDGTVWGGEFLWVEGASFRRVACLRRFRLPGADRAVREPRRAALGALFEVYGEALFGRRDLAPLRSFTDAELATLRQMLVRGVSSPVCSSAGRLFDAVASITSVSQHSEYEGQAAMALEFAIEDGGAAAEAEPYPFAMSLESSAEPQRLLVVDWEPTLRAVLDDVANDMPVGIISKRFHTMLAEAVVEVAKEVGQKRVVLTGGCFQNRFLTERTVRRLEAEGHRPYWHQRIPPNDGGIALGQAAAASRSEKGGRHEK